MKIPTGFTKKSLALVSSIVFVAITVTVSVAFASLTFNGTSINGDSNSSVDATGTITIGASSATGITIGRAGITATFPGTVTITGTTTTLQNLIVSGNCSGCGVGNFTAGGDLSGTSASQTVIGIQGHAVTSTAPSANQVLTWNGSFWTPENVSSTGGSGLTSINGLTNGTTSIVGAGTVTVSTSSPNIITITGVGSGAITINSLTTSTFLIQGTTNQITVATSAPNIVNLSLPQNIGTSSMPTFGGLTVNGTATTTNLTISGITGSTQCLHVNASGTVSGTGSDCGSGGGGTITLDGITSSSFSFAAAGTGLTVASSANPNAVTYTWTNPGYVLASGNNTWTGTQTFDATATFLGPIVESSTGAGSIELSEGTCPSGSSGVDILCANSSHAFESSLNGGSFFAIPEIAGDIGGIASTPVVVGLQGNPISSTAPSTNQVLTWNGSTWLPENASGTGGGSGGSLSTSSAITTGTFPFWTGANGALSGTSTVSASGNTVTNSGNAQIGGTLNVTSTATLQATTTVLGNVALGTSTVNSGANLFASYGSSGTTTLMLGATTTPRTGCLELVGDGGSSVFYLTISSAGALQISSSTCL